MVMPATINSVWNRFALNGLLLLAARCASRPLFSGSLQWRSASPLVQCGHKLGKGAGLKSVEFGKVLIGWNRRRAKI
jgi:hypothetical protein